MSPLHQIHYYCYLDAHDYVDENVWNPLIKNIRKQIGEINFDRLSNIVRKSDVVKVNAIATIIAIQIEMDINRKNKNR